MRRGRTNCDGGGQQCDTRPAQAGGSEQVDHVAAHHVGWRVSCLLDSLWQGRKGARAKVWQVVNERAGWRNWRACHFGRRARYESRTPAADLPRHVAQVLHERLDRLLGLGNRLRPTLEGLEDLVLKADGASVGVQWRVQQE